MEKELCKVKDIEEKLLSNSKDGLNQSIEAKVLNVSSLDNYDFYNLTIVFYNFKFNQFIINKKDFESTITDIKIELKDLKLKMIKNNNYLLIRKYTKIENNLKSNENANVNLFKLNLPILETNLKLKKSQKNIAIKLKAKEEESIDDFSYKFSNILNNNLSIEDPLNEYSEIFENKICYLFNGFNYEENKLIPINISSIEIVDENYICENFIFNENIFNIVNDSIINFKAEIKDIEMTTLVAEIEELNTKCIFNVKLNLDLIQKINQNSLCEFICFKKRNDNSFEFTELSDVISDQNTYVELIFLEFSEKYYDMIRINDNYYNIDKEKMTFKLESNDKENIFEQKFIYIKGNENLIEASYEFYLEINKGRTNCFESYLRKEGGFTFQMYFQSNEENKLPGKIKIKTGTDNYIYLDHFENFDNNLKRRFTLINTIRQDFIKFDYTKRTFRLNEAEFIDYEKYKNLKLYCLMKVKTDDNHIYENTIYGNDDSKDIFAFELYEDDKKKIHFKVEEKNKINKLFQDIKKNNGIIENYSDQINQLFKENGYYYTIFKKGFKNYIFNDSKSHYEIIKKLVYLYIISSFPKGKSEINDALSFFQLIINTISDTDYLTKIKVLIYIFNYIKDITIYKINIIDIYDENNNTFGNYKACFDSFKIFFKIIDSQKEKCAFYQGIHQFNGKIKRDLIRNIEIYSGYIISLKDIKFELLKRINRFCFVNTRVDGGSEATYSLSSNIISFYPLTFMERNDYFNFNSSLPRITSGFLFLVFHELCGHLKSNINNNQNSPNYYLDSNLNLIYTDSGYTFESILAGNIINTSVLISDEKADKLSNINLYTQENFNDLQNLINEFPKKILLNKTTYKYSDKTKPGDNNEEEEENVMKNNELPESFLKELEEVQKNLDNYKTYHSLYPLFRIPKGMSVEKFNELLKNNIVFKKFMKFQPNEDEKY